VDCKSSAAAPPPFLRCCEGMDTEPFIVLNGTHPDHWPQLPARPLAKPSSDNAGAVDRGDTHCAVVRGVERDHEGVWTAALLEYVQQWLDIPPPPASTSTSIDGTATGNSTGAAAQAAIPAEATLSDDTALPVTADNVVSPVAMLNVLLVSIPGAAPASAFSSPSPTSPAPAASVGCSNVDRPTITMAAPVSVLATEYEAASRDVGVAAARLLRHSKWLASGASHAAGVAPRLASAHLLVHAYHHALTRTPASSPVPTASTETLSDTALQPSSSSEALLAGLAALPCPPVYRGCLVLLLFHREHALRLVARDVLLRFITATPPSAAAGSSDPPPTVSAEASLRALLDFALQLLCTLKHILVLPSLLSFTETRGTAGTGTLVVVVAQSRVQTIMEGVLHLLTLLTVWDMRFGAALEAWSTTPVKDISTDSVAAAAGTPASTLPALLGRCRATVVLLGGSLVLYGIQALHQSVCRAVMEAWTHQHRLRPLSAGSAATMDVQRAAKAAMAHLLHPANVMLSSNPRMPKAAAVSAAAVKKTLVKVLVHCLLDNASGIAGSKEEEAWRRTRLRWLWGFAAALEPPSSRVAAPLLHDPVNGTSGASRLVGGGDVCGANTNTTAAAQGDASASVLVPERTAGWLLKPLLKNADQQFQWPSAVATAKLKPLSVLHDVAAARVAAEAVAVLDKAVYGLHLLLDTAVEALPRLLATHYFHDVLVSHESVLLTLAIGGIVHTRTLHALRLHRLLFTADVRAFAAGAAARQSTLHTPTSYANGIVSEGVSGGYGCGSHSSRLFEVPIVCLQRVWLTLPTLITQVCKTTLVGTGAAVATRLPLPQVLAHLCGALTTLVDADADPCAQWLLLSATEAMAAAPPPFRWVVQRCLRTTSDVLREQHDMLEKAWLGLPVASVAPSASARAAATAAAASRLLTEEKTLLRFVHTLRFVAAGDGGLRRLGEHLSAVFCVGVTPPVTHTMTAEAAAWVWRSVVLAQPTLVASVMVPRWDITDPAVANVARAQGSHWLMLLAECNWGQQSDWMVRCGWWMCALLSDVVTLEAEQRRVLAEVVVLSLPTAPMLQVSHDPHHDESDAMASTADSVDGPRITHQPPCKSLDCRQQEAAEKVESDRLSAVVQRLFMCVLRKAETYPKASLDRLLLHISNALSPTRTARDEAFHRAVQPLLVRLCQRRRDVQQSLSTGVAPWLQEWTAAAVRSMTACLAEQERCFRQFEIEEEILQREQDDAAKAASWEAQLRRTNESKRAQEMSEARLLSSRTASSGSTTKSLRASTSEMAAASVTSSSSSRLLRQQLLFLERPLMPLAAEGHAQQGGVKRERSLTPPPVTVEVEKEVVDCSDADVVVFDVDSDVEEHVSDDTALLDRLLQPPAPRATSATPSVPFVKVPKTEKAVTAAPPTRLQQKLQVINARNTHRVHHAEQLRQLQDRLCRVAASTNLLHLQPPLINDIIGAGSQCMAPTVPVLPEVFVSAATVLGDTAPGSSGSSGTAVSMPFGDAASIYAVRFAPHIALELRCDIIRSYEDLLDGVAKTARHALPHRDEARWHTRPDARQLQGTTASTEIGASTVAFSWTQLLPLHPSIPRTCFAVHNTGAAQLSSMHDSLSTRFSIRACVNPAMSPQHALRSASAAAVPDDLNLPSYAAAQSLMDPAVRSVAEQGLSAGLSEGDVVVVLLPLHTVAAAWVERQLDGSSLSSLPEAEQGVRAEAALSMLPRSWRMLGCVTQVCYVQSLLPGERTAQLCTYPPVEGRGSSSPPSAGSVAPLRFVHALRMSYSTPQHIFYVKKLTSLNSFQMELAALHRIDHTRFAATLYDPRHAAPLNATFYSWITSVLTAAGPARLPLLSQLRARLLLQRSLNDWQIRAIIAVLYATCPEWDEGDARRSSLAATAPRAPEVLLIEGPPGTGKTQTIGSLTLNLLHHLSRTRGATARVLVCAPSNCAVDEALLRVVHLREQLLQASHGVAGVATASLPSPSNSAQPTSQVEPCPAYHVLSGSILRVGVKDRVDPAVLRLPQRVFFDDVVEQRMAGCANMGGGNGGSRARGGGGAGPARWVSERNAIRASTIESASVIFSTLGSLHHISRQVEALTFDVVIVDEASQGTEPAVLQALVLARSKCVLVGDSKQLQPTILSTDASRCGLRRSLLVRMLACGHKSFLLRTQYRMHPDICAFPNAYFYESKLETHHSVLQRSRTGSRTSGLLSDDAVGDAGTATIAQCLGQAPRFVFVDVPESAMERRRGRSLLNRREAAAVVQYMRQLRVFLRLSVRDMAPQLGIITFYNAQKDVILSMLTREERQSGLQVASVDSFQGKEKRVILLSCVRTVRRSQLLPCHTTEKEDEAEMDEGHARGRRRGDAWRHHRHLDDDTDTDERPTMEERVGNRPVGCFGLGFLADGHRLNVALTRAQDLCVCFGSRESLEMVGEAVLASRARTHASQTHALTTADSLSNDVVHQLDADDEDPLALYSMLRHAEEHDLSLHPPPPPSVRLENQTDSVEVVEAPATSAGVAACVRYSAQTQLMKELAQRARTTAECEGRH
jgi:hypothetical protein